jgi:hypothetical protein
MICALGKRKRGDKGRGPTEERWSRRGLAVIRPSLNTFKLRLERMKSCKRCLITSYAVLKLQMLRIIIQLLVLIVTFPVAT